MSLVVVAISLWHFDNRELSLFVLKNLGWFERVVLQCSSKEDNFKWGDRIIDTVIFFLGDVIGGSFFEKCFTLWHSVSNNDMLFIRLIVLTFISEFSFAFLASLLLNSTFFFFWGFRIEVFVIVFFILELSFSLVWCFALNDFFFILGRDKEEMQKSSPKQ